MTVLRAFAIILGAGLGFALLGAGIGLALARVAPGYYPAVFNLERRAQPIDPAEVGIGLGFSQGAVAGIIMGMVVVLAVAISARGPKPVVPSVASWNESGRSVPSSTEIQSGQRA